MLKIIISTMFTFKFNYRRPIHYNIENNTMDSCERKFDEFFVDKTETYIMRVYRL